MKGNYTVSQVILEKQARRPMLLRKGERLFLEESMALSVGDHLETFDGWVEVRDSDGLVIRLGPSSELSYVFDPYGGIVSHPAERPSLIFYGEIFKFRYYVRPLEVVACGKYRTSCWYCPSSFYVRNLDANRDAYYALAGEVPVWERDEEGTPFDIVRIPEGHKAILRHDQLQPMRKRYTVEEVSPVSAEEWDYIVSNFMNPKRWQKYPEGQEVVTAG